jgi:hypothetical protein
MPAGPPPQPSGGGFAFDANVAVAEGSAAGVLAANAGMALGQAPLGPPPNARPTSGRPSSGRPPSRPPPPPVIVQQGPGAQPFPEPLAFPVPVMGGPGGPPMIQGVGPLIQAQPPGPGQLIPPNAQPIPLGATPAIAVPAGLPGAVRPDGSLQNVFPYAPGDNMVTDDVNTLFGRESHRQ